MTTHLGVTATFCGTWGVWGPDGWLEAQGITWGMGEWTRRSALRTQEAGGGGGGGWEDDDSWLGLVNLFTMNHHIPQGFTALAASQGHQACSTPSPGCPAKAPQRPHRALGLPTVVCLQTAGPRFGLLGAPACQEVERESWKTLYFQVTFKALPVPASWAFAGS